MVSQTAKEITVVNDALTLVGHEAIHDFEGGIPGSEAAARLYPLVLGQLLDAYDWRFALSQIQLVQLTDPPLTKYKYAHQLPADRDGVPARFYSDTAGSAIEDSGIYTDALHSNHPTVYCDYVKSGGISGSFRNLLVRALAADFAIALCDDRGLHDRYYRAAYGTPSEGGRGGLFKTAASHDAKGAEPRSVIKVGRGPLVEAHQSAGHGGRGGFENW